MKVLSYNLMSGGFNSYNDNSAIPQRLDKLVVAVKSANADLVSIIDTYRWNEVFSEERIAKVFEYPNVFSTTLDDIPLEKSGIRNGITVISRHKIRKFEKIWLYNRNAIKVEVEIDGKITDIFCLYLDSSNEDLRLKQVEALFSYVDKNKATILTGDFNSIDKADLSKSQRDILLLLAKFPQVKSMEGSFREMERGEVTRVIKSHDFVDADEYKKRPTIPTKLFQVYLPKPILRLDYAFYNKFARVINFEVLMGRLWEYTSDHYPIMFEVK